MRARRRLLSLLSDWSGILDTRCHVLERASSGWLVMIHTPNKSPACALVPHFPLPLLRPLRPNLRSLREKSRSTRASKQEDRITLSSIANGSAAMSKGLAAAVLQGESNLPPAAAGRGRHSRAPLNCWLARPSVLSLQPNLVFYET